MYTTYEFYATRYFGDMIPEDVFEKFCQRSCDEIDVITFDRLAEGLPTNERAAARAQRAVCALAELFYRIEAEDRKAEESTGIINKEDGTVIGKQITTVSYSNRLRAFTSFTAVVMVLVVVPCPTA